MAYLTLPLTPYVLVLHALVEGADKPHCHNLNPKLFNVL
jgi:hypothetical protein